MTPEPALHENPQLETVNAYNKDKLTQAFVDRIERAMIESKNAADDLKQIIVECKDAGFLPKTIAAMKAMAKIRMNDTIEEAREKLETLERVSRAVGVNLFNWSEDLADRE